jgi:hypothetical protein
MNLLSRRFEIFSNRNRGHLLVVPVFLNVGPCQHDYASDGSMLAAFFNSQEDTSVDNQGMICDKRSTLLL